MKKKEEKSRIDKIVENAGTKLASNYTRRSFLGKMATAAGAVAWGGAFIIGDSTPAEANTFPGCWSQNNVNCQYYPILVTGVEGAGYCTNGVYLRKGPAWNAPIVYNGGTPYIVYQNTYCAGQCQAAYASSGCPAQGRQWHSCYTGTTQWYWVCMSPSGGKSGWVPGTDLAGNWILYGDPNGPICCGPAGYDADARYGYGNGVCTNASCGGSTNNNFTSWTGYKKLCIASGENGSDMGQTFYIRYAPDSTPFGWLVPGDHIYVHGYQGPYWCVAARYCKWVPYQTAGWIGPDNCANAESMPSSYGFGCGQNHT